MLSRGHVRHNKRLCNVGGRHQIQVNSHYLQQSRTRAVNTYPRWKSLSMFFFPVIIALSTKVVVALNASVSEILRILPLQAVVTAVELSQNTYLLISALARRLCRPTDPTIFQCDYRTIAHYLS